MKPTDYPVSFSHLKQFAHSPAHYLHSLTSGVKVTPAMRLGNLVDAMVFGFDYLIAGEDKRSKEYKDALKTGPINRYGDKVVYTESEHDTAKPIVAAVKSSRVAQPYLAGTYNIETQWSMGPRSCVSHPDVLGGNYIADLKVTNSTEPSKFSRHAEDMAWHAQLTWYKQAVTRAYSLKIPISELVLIGVESSGPHNVTVLRMPEQAIQDGDRLCRKWFEQLIACEASGVFPGYTDRVFDMELRGRQTEMEVEE